MYYLRTCNRFVVFCLFSWDVCYKIAMLFTKKSLNVVERPLSGVIPYTIVYGDLQDMTYFPEMGAFERITITKGKKCTSYS